MWDFQLCIKDHLDMDPYKEKEKNWLSMHAYAHDYIPVTDNGYGIRIYSMDGGGVLSVYHVWGTDPNTTNRIHSLPIEELKTLNNSLHNELFQYSPDSLQRKGAYHRGIWPALGNREGFLQEETFELGLQG